MSHHAEDSYDRWVERAEKAEARVAELEAALIGWDALFVWDPFDGYEEEMALHLAFHSTATASVSEARCARCLWSNDEMFMGKPDYADPPVLVSACDEHHAPRRTSDALPVKTCPICEWAEPDCTCPKRTDNPEPDERSDQAKWFVKARVYGAIAAEYQHALEAIAKCPYAEPVMRAKQALAWRHSESGGVPRSAVDEIGALLRMQTRHPGDPHERGSEAAGGFGQGVDGNVVAAARSSG